VDCFLWEKAGDDNNDILVSQHILVRIRNLIHSWHTSNLQLKSFLSLFLGKFGGDGITTLFSVVNSQYYYICMSAFFWQIFIFRSYDATFSYHGWSFYGAAIIWWL